MTSDEAAIERIDRAIHRYHDGRCWRMNDGPPIFSIYDGDNREPIERVRGHVERVVRIRELNAKNVLAAFLAEPPPAVERAVLERLLTELDEMRQHYRGNSYLAERVQWTADWLRDKRAALAQEESDGRH